MDLVPVRKEKKRGSAGRPGRAKKSRRKKKRASPSSSLESEREKGKGTTKKKRGEGRCKNLSQHNNLYYSTLIDGKKELS